METEFRASNGFHKTKKPVNKIILFPIDRNSYSTSQSERFIKKIRFHYAKKLLSSAGISKKHVKKIASNSRREVTLQRTASP